MRGTAYRWLLLCFALFLLSPMKDSSAQGPAPAIITGRVTLNDGKPAAGEMVIVRSTDYVSPEPSGTAVTDAAGRYTVSIDTGLFPLLFVSAQSPAPPPDAHFSVTVRIGSNLYLQPASRSVTLAPSQTISGTDFLVTTGPQVTVHIHDALTGRPISDVSIFDNQLGSSSTRPKLGVTDTQGVAVFHLTSLHAELSLLPPNTYKLPIQVAPGYLAYKQVWLQEAQDVVWEIKTYSDPIPATMPWQGTVLEPNSLPASGVTVHILRHPEIMTQTDNNGHFSVNLPPLKTDEADSMGHLTVAVLAERGKQSVVLTPTSEAVWGGMTLRLTDTPLSSIIGTAVDAQGYPESGVSVSCYGNPLMSGAVLTRLAENGGVTDEAGRFTITGLPAGRFRLSLRGGQFGDTSFPPGNLSFWDPKAVLSLGVGQQDDLGRITVPVADQTLTGRLVTDTGQFVMDPGRPNPDHNIWLTITGAHTGPTGDIDKDGQFHAAHLVAEPLTLTITAFFPMDGGRWTTKEIAHVPVQAGQQDVRVVVPAASLPPNAVTMSPTIVEKERG